MNLREWFLEFFREKEYYSINKESFKNELSNTFKVITNHDLVQIKKVITSWEDVVKIEDLSKGLLLQDSEIFYDIDNLISRVKEIISEDYKDSYFRSQKEKWDFQYSFNSLNDHYKGTLFISNSMTYPNDQNFGDVIYHLLAIRKKDNIFYLWDLLDKDF
ncbi:hypothetical protein APR41_18145 [Salegentibacter salinarum]|uniref:Uncharacterized protein n=1 Tax=Salegentibacter salinarum TaxID=447422 RepID=A0A2N0TTH5_9FLAO|nr:hypothetical protein [Salegentibacter salinarum]PKD18034.1 hypothetical protein APR41_18145 [Salegentibacter salinarum]SKB99382.1 hypothetical protein SAMN05660903_03697 [Salegentibacter salinarum]